MTLDGSFRISFVPVEITQHEKRPEMVLIVVERTLEGLSGRRGLAYGQGLESDMILFVRVAGCLGDLPSVALPPTAENPRTLD